MLPSFAKSPTAASSSFLAFLFLGFLLWTTAPASLLYESEDFLVQTWTPAQEVPGEEVPAVWAQGRFDGHSGPSLRLTPGEVVWVALQPKVPAPEAIWVTWGSLPLQASLLPPTGLSLPPPPDLQGPLYLNGILLPDPTAAPVYFFRLQADSWLSTDLEVLSGYEYQARVLKEQLKLYPLLGALLLLGGLLLVSQVGLSKKLQDSTPHDLGVTRLLATFCLALSLVLAGYNRILPLPEELLRLWTLGWAAAGGALVLQIQVHALGGAQEAPQRQRLHRAGTVALIGIALAWGLGGLPGWQNALLLQVLLLLLPLVGFQVGAWFQGRPVVPSVVLGLSVLLLSALLLQLKWLLDLTGPLVLYQNLFLALLALNVLLVVAVYVNWRNALLEAWGRETARLQEAQVLDQYFRRKLADSFAPELSTLTQVMAVQLKWLQASQATPSFAQEGERVEERIRSLQQVTQAMAFLREPPAPVLVDVPSLVPFLTESYRPTLKLGQQLQVEEPLPEVSVEVPPHVLRLTLAYLLDQTFQNLLYGTLSLRFTVTETQVHLELRAPLPGTQAGAPAAEGLFGELASQQLEELLLEKLLQQLNLSCSRDVGSEAWIQVLRLPRREPPDPAPAFAEAPALVKVLCRAVLWETLQPYIQTEPLSGRGQWTTDPALCLDDLDTQTIYLLEAALVPPEAWARLEALEAPVLLLTGADPVCPQRSFQEVKLPEEGARLEVLLVQAWQQLTPPQADSVAQQRRQPENRAELVNLMTEAVRIWNEATGQDRVALAVESRTWKVQVESETQILRTRALDRYFRVETLPQNPRWQSALNTIGHVTDACLAHPDAVKLQERLQHLTQKVL